MKRSVFYSFHYEIDNWRAAQIRSMGVVDGNRPVTDNDWEKVVRGGDKAIQNWIDNQMQGRFCVIVLIGQSTAGRKWINYEIRKGWKDKKGMSGIYVHNLKDKDGKQAVKGRNPFQGIVVDGVNLSQLVETYDPPFSSSQKVYEYIGDHLATWVESAISTRWNH